MTVVGNGLRRVFEPLAADHRSEAEKTNFCRTYFPNHDDDSPFKATFSLSLSHSLSLSFFLSLSHDSCLSDETFQFSRSKTLLFVGSTEVRETARRHSSSVESSRQKWAPTFSLLLLLLLLQWTEVEILRHSQQHTNHNNDDDDDNDDDGNNSLFPLRDGSN